MNAHKTWQCERCKQYQYPQDIMLWTSPRGHSSNAVCTDCYKDLEQGKAFDTVLYKTMIRIYKQYHELSESKNVLMAWTWPQEKKIKFVKAIRNGNWKDIKKETGEINTRHLWNVFYVLNSYVTSIGK